MVDKNLVYRMSGYIEIANVMPTNDDLGTFTPNLTYNSGEVTDVWAENKVVSGISGPVDGGYWRIDTTGIKIGPIIGLDKQASLSNNYEHAIAVNSNGALLYLSGGSWLNVSAGAGTTYTNEQAQDAVGGILDDGTLGDVNFTYNDGTPKIYGVVEDNSHSHVEANISNLNHYDSADFASDLATKDTGDLAEGTNLYHTQARVESIISAELADGESIDNAIDALIAAHEDDIDSHYRIGNNIYMSSGCSLSDIQSAINELDSASNEGGTVWLPEGNWTIDTTTLTIEENVTLKGTSNTKTIFSCEMDDSIVMENRSQIKDCYIYHVDLGSAEYALNVGGNYCVVENCYFRGDSAQTNRGLIAGGDYFHVSNCTFYEGDRTVIGTTAFGGSFVFCKFYNLDYGITAYGDHCIIMGNFFDGCDTYQIFLSGDYNTIHANSTSSNAPDPWHVDNGTGNEWSNGEAEFSSLSVSGSFVADGTGTTLEGDLDVDNNKLFNAKLGDSLNADGQTIDNIGDLKLTGSLQRKDGGGTYREGYIYVPVGNDDNSWDFSGITSSQVIDCSSIVPDGAVAIHIRFTAKCSSANRFCLIKKNGNSYGLEAIVMHSQIANYYIDNNGTVECNDDRELYYSEASGAWTAYVQILGYYI